MLDLHDYAWVIGQLSIESFIIGKLSVLLPRPTTHTHTHTCTCTHKPGLVLGV
jgi:hypothetical protein